MYQIFNVAYLAERRTITMVSRRCRISSDSLASIALVEPEHDPLAIDVRSEVKPLLRRVSPVVARNRGWRMAALPLLLGDKQTFAERPENVAHDPLRS